MIYKHNEDNIYNALGIPKKEWSRLVKENEKDNIKLYDNFEKTDNFSKATEIALDYLGLVHNTNNKFKMMCLLQQFKKTQDPVFKLMDVLFGGEE